MSDVLKSYYESAFALAGEGGSIYAPMSVLEYAGHMRKGELLAALDLPNLEQATVVDYGVGSWGFGCVFPKLKQCRRAIGIDISEYAIECSQKLAKSDPHLRAKSVDFITSTGYEIQLEDDTADIFFAGECIEHIEDTPAFLDEVRRVLKSDGIAIFTTPNSRPHAYRELNLRWAMGLEHVALMDVEELTDVLSRSFELLVVKGYNSTVHPEVDASFKNETAARDWARTCEDQPELASGIVAMVRKRPEGREVRKKVAHRVIESNHAIAKPRGRDLELFDGVLGRMAEGADAVLEVSIPKGATRISLVFWAHPWSGIAEIGTNNTSLRRVDLYSHVSGCVRVALTESDFGRANTIEIRRAERQSAEDQRSLGSEVIFFRAVCAIEA
jgi:ubiquinone/menaquinone biosynthesis C-methylase UbiE